MSDDIQKLGQIRFQAKRETQSPVDLEAFGGEAIVRLAVASIMRGKLENIRPQMCFWTKRQVHGSRVIIYGQGANRVEAKEIPSGHLPKPADATAFVRVWTLELCKVLQRRYPDIWQSTEAASRAMIMVGGPSPETIRKRTEVFAAMLEKIALKDGDGTFVRPADATEH